MNHSPGYFIARRLGLLVTLCCGLSVALHGQQSPPGQPELKREGPGGRRLIIGGPGGAPELSPEAKAMPQPKNDTELAASIKALAGTLAAAGRFSGSIYLAKDGGALVNGAWGLADQEKQVPNTPDTAFDTGSIGKLFTQTAVLQMVDQGKLGLDDPIGKYLPDYPSREIAAKVTLRQLLLHTSGLGDIFDHITPDTNLAGMLELKDFLPLFRNRPLEFEPGTRNRYSNAGYVVLGMVIEAVSGENYYDYVPRHILTPAGLTRSGFFNRSQLPATVARSYHGAEDMTGMHPGRGSPAGGLQATAGDLARLVLAINDGKLLKPESVTIVNSLLPRPPGAPPLATGKLIAYGIEGGAPGVNAHLVVDPTGHYTRVVLCNGEPPMASSMGFTIREWIRNLPK